MFWAFLCISKAPFGRSLWSGHHWKGLFLLQTLSINDANFGQNWRRQKWKKGQGCSRAVTGGTGVNGLTKTRSGNSSDYRGTIVSEIKCFPSTRKREACVCKFLRFEERFRKTSFSWRISVDGTPNRRNKAAFFKFLRRNLDGELNLREHKNSSPSNARYS